MFGLYFFGTILEEHFVTHPTFGFAGGEAIYILFYTTAIYAAVLPQQIKLKDDKYYASLGASGAVNSVIFAFILVSPMSQMGLFFIPFIRLPAWVFGLLYLAISYFLARRKSNNPMVGRINHEAHFWGAFYGLIFMAVVEPDLLKSFLFQVSGGRIDF
jgi:membrane associated rhomboid family serine protease